MKLKMEFINMLPYHNLPTEFETVCVPLSEVEAEAQADLSTERALYDYCVREFGEHTINTYQGFGSDIIGWTFEEEGGDYLYRTEVSLLDDNGNVTQLTDYSD